MLRFATLPRRSAAALVLAALAAGGCGDTEEDGAADAACGADDGRTVVVAIPAFSFEP